MTALFVMACGGTGDGFEPDEDLGTSSDFVQMAWQPAGFGHVWALTKAPLTGALRIPIASNESVSCGVTFISPRLALTAAHCVDEGITWPSTARVEQYDVTDMSMFDLANQGDVRGTWPNYTRPTPLPASKYRVTTYPGCVPVVGCHSRFLKANCPFTDDVDLALVYCPTRPSTAAYTQVHPVDRSNADVTVQWFHEVLSLKPDPNDAVPNAPSDNWEHYGRYSQDRTLNWHYRLPNHQLLPLESSSWPNGQQYKQLGHDVNGDTQDSDSRLTLTDVPVCHGTSGSGVFERGTTGVFGVVALWSADTRVGNFYRPNQTVEDRLCEDITSTTDGRSVQPGQKLMRHTRRQWAALIEAMPVVQNDRAQ